MPQLVTRGPRNNLEFLSGAAGKAWKDSSVATAVVHYYEGKQEALLNRIIAHGTFYTLRKCRPICCHFGLKKKNDAPQKVKDSLPVLRLGCGGGK